MKPQLKIQRAHDILVGLILDECKGMNLSEDSRHNLNIAASVLCWVLDHDHNPVFGEILQDIEKCTAELGYEIKGPSL